MLGADQSREGLLLPEMETIRLLCSYTSIIFIHYFFPEQIFPVLPTIPARLLVVSP